MLLLHGFSVSRYFWSAQVETLGKALLCRGPKHHSTFLAPDAVPGILADDARWL